MAKIKGVTESGFAFEIDDGLKNDMELVDAMAEMEEENGLAFSRVCLKILGKEQRKRLYDHLRDDTGKVPLDAVGEALKDIFSAMGTAGKN